MTKFFKLKKFIYSRFVIRYKILKKKIQQFFDLREDKKKLMVNIGGGYFFRRHWRVLDFPSPHYRFKRGVIDYKHNLTSSSSFPFEDESVFLIYSSHTLEHMPQEHCSFIFSEIYRILKRGGAVRISVPDFNKAADAYAKNNQDYFTDYSGKTIEEKFLNYFATYLQGKVNPKEFRLNFNSMIRKEFADFYTNKIPRKYHSDHGGDHINWWNYKKISRMLQKAGFTEIYKSQPQQSRFVEMRNLRDFDSTHPELSLIVEAKK